MRFLCIYKAEETKAPPSEQLMAEMGKLIGEMTQAGVLIATEGCLPSAKGARIRSSGGKLTVTDGPFTESKELVAGFALIQVDSKAEAIEWGKRFLQVAGEGESEIRQVAETSDCGHESVSVAAGADAEDRGRAQVAAKR